MLKAWADIVRSSRSSAWNRSILAGFAVSGVAVLLLAVSAAFGSILILESSFQYPVIVAKWQFANPTWMLMGGVVLGVGLTFLIISLRILSDDLFRILFSPLSSGANRFRPLLSLSILLAVFAVPVLAAATLAFAARSGIVPPIWQPISDYVIRHSGGAVNLVVSITSIVAFILMIHQLRDVSDRVGNFRDLVRRIQKLARTATADDPLHVIAFTPAVGFLALPAREWAHTKAAFIRGNELMQKTTMMITMKADDLEKWHGEFLGRSTYRERSLSKELINQSQTEAMDIKNALGNSNYIEVDRNSLPGFYCYFTNERAIIVTPLFLPIAGQKQEERERLPTPHMIGYETADRGTIDDLFRQFEYLKGLQHG